MNDEGIEESPFDYTFLFIEYPVKYLDDFSKEIKERNDWTMDEIRRLIWLYEMDCDAIMHLKKFGIHPVTGTKYEWGSCEFKDGQYNAMLKRNYKNINLLRKCWVKKMNEGI